ncbi:hypothetical protein KQI65_15335 [bacterium]|nr:hypothetical protein [bacterium]
MRTAILLRTGLPFLFAICCCAAASAQQHTIDPTLLEAFIDPEQEDDLEQILDDLTALQEQPLCLASATRHDLAALPFLDESDAAAIITIMNDSVPSWEALRRVFSGQPAQFTLLRACARLRCDEAMEMHMGLRSRFQQEDLPRQGYLDGSYTGSRARLLQRFRMSVGRNVHAAVLLEKDPGERMLTDHYAGYLSVENIGVLRKLVLGDAAVTAGQGLVFWQSFAMSKSSQATGVARRPSLLRARVSSSEGGGSRGVGLQLNLAPADLVLLFSSTSRDATIDEESGTAGSFGEDGLHRTESEQQRRSRVHEQLAGMHLLLSDIAPGLQCGTSMLAARYSVASLASSPFSFEGDRAWTGGLNLRWSGASATIYGEAALAHTHAAAFVAGTELQPHAHARLALLYRRYDAGFVSLQGNAFGERSGNTQNEEGLYCGLRLRPYPRLRADIWVDIFHYPNRTALLDLPASGSEASFGLSWRPFTRTEAALRVRSERKDREVAATDALGRDTRSLTSRNSTTLRLQLDHRSAENWLLRLRADYHHVSWDSWLPSSEGYMAGVDLRWQATESVKLTASCCAFHSGDWESRLYRFEYDVRGLMRSIACDGDGFRSYLLVDVAVAPRITIGARYALLVREGVQKIGSGRDAVEGDRLGILSLQLDWEYGP